MLQTFRPTGDGHFRALFMLLSEYELNRVRVDRNDGKTGLKYVQLGVKLRDAAAYDEFLVGPNALRGMSFTLESNLLCLQIKLGSDAAKWLGMHPLTVEEGKYPYTIFEDRLTATLPVSAAKTALGLVFGIEVCFGSDICRQCLAAAFSRNESTRTRSTMRRSGNG